jgi:hypothetical protein
MAVKCPTSSDYLQRTTNIVQPTSNYTCLFWVSFNPVAVNPYYQTGFITLDDPITYTYFSQLCVAGPGFDSLNLALGNASSNPDVAGSVPNANTWYSIGYVRTGTTHEFYVNGALIGSTVLDQTAGTFGYNLLGSDTYNSNSNGNIQITNFREWSVALTSLEINAEINSPTSVVNTGSLVTFTPLISDANDISGNGNNWTPVGSPTFVTEPSYPLNLSAATALDLGSLPVNATFNACPFGTYVFTLWFKYTTVSIDNVLSIAALGNNTTYFPGLIPYLNGSPVSGFGTSYYQGEPWQFGVESYSLTYYFAIVPGIGHANTTGQLTLLMQRFVNKNVPIGSVCIFNDGQQGDNYPYPVCFLDVTNNNTALAFINEPNFPVGEVGALLSTGYGCCDTQDANTAEDQIVIFNSTFGIVATVTSPSGSNFENISSDLATQFYVGYSSGTHYIVRTLSPASIFGSTLFDLGAQAVRNFAINPTNSILYYQVIGATTIKTWDLLTNAAGSNLTTGVLSSNICPDMICLTDGTIIYADITNNTIKHYSAAGSLLNTYTPPVTLTANPSPDRMCVGTDDTTFWMYLHGNENTDGVINVVQIRVSDGSVLVNKTYVVFPGTDAGYGQQLPLPTPSNIVMFGPSDSCPIMVMPVAYSPIDTGGTLVVGKASAPLATGVTFTITVSGNAPFTLQTDTYPGEVLDLPPGTYSVIETPNANYYPSYYVSNDPVNNNNNAVIVTSGEETDVVIVNSLKTAGGGLYIMNPNAADTPGVNPTSDQYFNQNGTFTQVMINWFFKLFIARDK